jgi:hypothetical protein
MCLNDSENAKAHAVHLETDDTLVEAYKRLCNGASLNVMKEPVTAFIAGRHGHYNPTAGPQGKHSSLAIARPVNPNAQLVNNLSGRNRQTDIVADHISNQSCIRCGGYILKSDIESSSNLPSSTPATHSDISHCLFHLSIVDAHLKDELTERQRLQLLNERTDMQGRHYCLVCNTNVDKLWDEGRGHGIVNAQSRKYFSLCQPKEMCREQYSLVTYFTLFSNNRTLMSFFLSKHD